MYWSPGAWPFSSCPIWAMTQKVQQNIAATSPNIDPSIPFNSRSFWRCIDPLENRKSHSINVNMCKYTLCLEALIVQRMVEFCRPKVILFWNHKINLDASKVLHHSWVRQYFLCQMLQLRRRVKANHGTSFSYGDATYNPSVDLSIHPLVSLSMSFLEWGGVGDCFTPTHTKGKYI